MKFIRQFEVRKISKKSSPRKKSATVQGAVLSTEKVVERMLAGNNFGLRFNANVSYDSDNPEFDENSVVHLDRSDRLISLVQLQNRHQYLENKKKIALAEAAERKAAELI